MRVKLKRVEGPRGYWRIGITNWYVFKAVHDDGTPNGSWELAYFDGTNFCVGEWHNSRKDAVEYWKKNYIGKTRC